MVSGACQILFGYLKAGSIANYIPSSVLEGMLAGIGVIIIINQLPDAVGYAKNNAAVMVDAEDGVLLNTINLAMHHIQEGALAISLIGLLFMVAWKNIPSKKLNIIPAGILVVLGGVLLNEVFILFVPRLALDSAHLVNLPIAASFTDFFKQISFPDFSGLASLKVWETGLMIALVASTESLLCIEATDKLDPLKRYTPTDRELKAQGIGNLVSGLLGGLPISSVIMRSSANINAGAQTKHSTILHGLLLLVCAATIPSWLNLIPKAAIAAILIYTGYRLFKKSVFKHMWEGGYEQFVPYMATMAGVVALGLFKGVAIGIAISVYYTLRQNIKLSYYYKRSTYEDGDLIKLTLAQQISFLNKASIKETLDRLPENSNVIIDASNTEYIDFDVLDIIREFGTTGAKEKGISISLTGFKEVYKLPTAAAEREIVAAFLHKEDVPTRSQGSPGNLLNQLRKGMYKPSPKQ
jgi:MFS superfamily sulfate permease-like transporter